MTKLLHSWDKRLQSMYEASVTAILNGNVPGKNGREDVPVLDGLEALHKGG
jgi:hypothetical protein